MDTDLHSSGIHLRGGTTMSTDVSWSQSAVFCVSRRSRGRNYEAELQKCRPEAILVEFGEYHPLKPIMVRFCLCLDLHISLWTSLSVCGLVHSHLVHLCRWVCILLMSDLICDSLRWLIQKAAMGPAKEAHPLPPPPPPPCPQTPSAPCSMGQTPCPCLQQHQPARLPACHTAPPQGWVQTAAVLSFHSVAEDPGASLKYILHYFPGPGKEKEGQGGGASGPRFWALVLQARRDPGQVHNHRETLHCESLRTNMFCCYDWTVANCLQGFV